MNNPLDAWWPKPETVSPLDAVRALVECLESGAAVPTPVAAIFSNALRLYLAGETDITRNLGLRPRRGGAHNTPVRMEISERRNDCIRAIYEAMPATTKTGKAEQTAQLLRCPVSSLVTEADVLGYAMRLHKEHGGTLPKSMRQVLRVVSGETVEGRSR